MTEPSVRRGARALEPGTMLGVAGASDEPFESTWNAEHFAGVPRAGDAGA